MHELINGILKHVEIVKLHSNNDSPNWRYNIITIYTYGKPVRNVNFFFLFAYCLLHSAFSSSRGMVKSEGHSDKGFNLQIPKVTMQHTNGGW